LAIRLTRTHVMLGVGLAALTLLAAWLRVRGLAFGLPAIYNPDEVAIMSRALAFAKGDLNPHNFLYPTLYFYVLFGWIGLYFAGAFLAGAVQSVSEFQQSLFTDPTAIYLAGRTLGVVCGTLSVIATWRLGERIGGRAVGLAAAAFLAVAPYAVRDAHYVKHDVPATLAIVLATLAVVVLWTQPGERSRWRQAVIAGAACGLAASVHYYAVFVVTALALAIWMPGEARLSARERLQLTGLAFGAAAVAFLAGTPFLLAEPRTAWQDVVANRRIVMDRAVDASGGLFPSLGTYLRMLWTHAVGWPVATLAVAGGAVLARRAPARLLLLTAFPLVFIAFISNTVPATRYLNPVFPFVAVLAGIAVSAAAETVYWRPLAAALLVALAGLPGLVDSLYLGWFFRQTDTRTLAREYIERSAPAGATVLVQPYSVPLQASREALIEALRHHLGDEANASVKFQIQLGLSPYPQPAYRLLWLGSGGHDVDKLYVEYAGLQGEQGRDRLDALGAQVIVLKAGESLTPEAAGLATLLARYGRRAAVFSPFRSGAVPGEQPFLHNTDADLTAGLSRPGPVVEVWHWRSPGAAGGSGRSQ
jgi:Dolichyl-phosphate-mannose-protein mannosyltransferase